MNSKSVICILLSIALLNVASAAGEGGVNVEPNVDETIFSEITHTETTTDLEDWEITLTLSDDAINNNTTFELTTQMCNNDGVCLPPTVAEVSTTDGKIFTSAVTTIEDHSYVNWRVKATYTLMIMIQQKCSPAKASTRLGQTAGSTMENGAEITALQTIRMMMNHSCQRWDYSQQWLL